MARRGTVWLVGMMGAGKSAVGACLARRLHAELVDTDHEIEKRAGASIAEIFARQGEPAFRRLEREAVERVAGRPVVAALGGGAIARPELAERIAATGTVVYLRARPETLLARVGEAEGRPLLEGLDPAAREARLRSLLTQREVHYAKAAVVVDTDGLAADEVAELVARRLEMPT